MQVYLQIKYILHQMHDTDSQMYISIVTNVYLLLVLSLSICMGVATYINLYDS